MSFNLVKKMVIQHLFLLLDLWGFLEFFLFFPLFHLQ